MASIFRENPRQALVCLLATRPWNRSVAVDWLFNYRVRSLYFGYVLLVYRRHLTALVIAVLLARLPTSHRNLNDDFTSRHIAPLNERRTIQLCRRPQDTWVYFNILLLWHTYTTEARDYSERSSTVFQDSLKLICESNSGSRSLLVITAKWRR